MIKSPLSYLISVLFITCLSLGWLVYRSYVNYSSEKYQSKLKSNIQKQALKLLHLNEILSKSAQMSVVDEDKRWLKRYHKSLIAYDKKLSELEDNVNRYRVYVGLNKINNPFIDKRVRKLEESWINLPNEKSDLKRKIAFGDEYRISRKGLIESIRDNCFVEDKNARLQELRFKIIILDEVLTMSSRLAVATGNVEFKSEYEENVLLLDNAIKEAMELSPGNIGGEAAQLTNEANKVLVEMEERALKLLEGSKREEAKDLLFSSTYEKNKEIYAEGMNIFYDRLNSESIEILKKRNFQELTAVIIGVSVTILLIFLFFIILKLIRTWQNQMEALNRELQEAHDELEDRVERRTSQLKIMNDKLKGEIKERVEVELSLIESESRFKAVIDTAEDAIISIDSKGNIVSWNNGARKIFRFKAEEVIGKPLSVIIPESFRAMHEKGLNDFLSTGKSKVMGETVELIGLNKTGQNFPIELSIAAWNAQGDKFFTGIIRDISKRKESERESALLSSIINTTPDIVGILNSSNKEIVYLNNAAQELLGEIFDENGIRRSYDDFHPDWMNEKIQSEIFPEVMEKGIWKGEGEWQSRDGREIPSSMVVFRHLEPDTGESFISTIARDISEVKELQSQFMQSQKMEVVGRLAGGVAHDFNNIMMIINGNCDLITGQLNEENEIYEDIKEIRRAGERAANLTRQLLTFSRKQPIALEAIDLNLTVEQLEKMLGRLIGDDVLIEIKKNEKIKSISADRGQLEQILTNLVINARDAMPDGGTITIETNRDIVARPIIRGNLSIKEGEYTTLTVTDTGTGMSPEMIERIFDPFYTTKEPGKGTGLGLSTVYGIMEQYKGCVDVISDEGRGTCFKLYFPVVEEDSKIEEVHQINGFKINDKILKGLSKVLVVDDEENVKNIVVKVLKAQNCDVVSTSSPSEAITLAENMGSELSLIISDIVMPKVNGPEMVSLIKKANPKVEVIFMSGYIKEEILNKYKLESNENILSKPFTPNDLIGKINEIFGEV